MIVAKDIDYVGITGAAQKMAVSAHAAYWLHNHGAETSGPCGIQDRAIMEGIREIAGLLGYRLEKVAAPDPTTDVPMFKPRPGLSDAGVPV